MDKYDESLVESAKQIQEHQRECGNDAIRVTVKVRMYIGIYL